MATRQSKRRKGPDGAGVGSDGNDPTWEPGDRLHDGVQTRPTQLRKTHNSGEENANQMMYSQKLEKCVEQLGELEKLQAQLQQLDRQVGEMEFKYLTKPSKIGSLVAGYPNLLEPLPPPVVPPTLSDIPQDHFIFSNASKGSRDKLRQRLKDPTSGAKHQGQQAAQQVAGKPP